MPILTETPPTPDLVGTTKNPARDLQARDRAGEKGSIGDKAFMDAVLIVALAWLLLILLAVSLRNHNI